MNKSFHTPVLTSEVLEYLNVRPAATYIDATLGGGGHTKEILKRGGIVLGFDADQEAIDFVEENFQFPISNFQLRVVRGNFKDIKTIAIKNGFEKVEGILFDLGVSSHQLDTPRRGFSFTKEGPLDMRMDESLSVKAMDLINALSKGELNELFNKLGEEYRSGSISQSIVSARKIKKIESTTELANIIEKAVGRKDKIHPATKVFQALRIAVNDELNNIKAGLQSSIGLLKKKGRLVVISFHSLESRIVKQMFLDFEKKGMGKVITIKPVKPTGIEIHQNIRARSALLRVFERQ